MDVFAKHLDTLLTEGSIAASRISSKQKAKHRTLFDNEILGIERIANGKRYVVKDVDNLRRYIKKIFPRGLEKAIQGPSCRAEGVAFYRNAKTKNVSDREALLIKVFSDRHDLILFNDLALPILPWCQVAGIAAIELKDTDSLTVKGKLALVENIDVFWDFDKTGVEVDAVIYTGGRFSKRLLHSLVPDKALSIIHFGDYDPVGVEEYLRVKKVFPSTIFHVPDNLESLFEFSCLKILEKKNNQRILARLRHVEDSTVQYIVSLMDKENGGLEHEILIYDFDTTR